MCMVRTTVKFIKNYLQCYVHSNNIKFYKIQTTLKVTGVYANTHYLIFLSNKLFTLFTLMYGVDCRVYNIFKVFFHYMNFIIVL